MDLKKLLKDIEEDARVCAMIFRDADRKNLDIDTKEGNANFVTKYDKLVQREIKKRLEKTFPEAVFVGEEEDIHSSIESGYAFIVDPIDGTNNFIRDYHSSVISVALLKDKEPVLGVVYNPYTDEMFTAIKGQGAFLNGEPIHVSKRKHENGMLIFGSSAYYKELKEKTYEMLVEYSKKVLDFRRSGAAALDLCTIACGRAEVFFELRLCPWDYAAGGLIVKEAGGIARRIEGGDLTYDKPCSVYAENGVV